MTNEICNGCEFTLREFTYLCQDESKLKKFLVEHGCLLSEKNCPKCGQICKIYKKKPEDANCYFRCQKTYSAEGKDNKKTKLKCNYLESCRKNTFFSGSKIPVDEICLFVAYSLAGFKTPTKFLCHEFKMQNQTVVDWRYFIKEVYLDWAAGSNDGKLGGPGKIVEIDESKVGSRKNNDGRIIEGQWVFAGIERDSNRFFVVPVEKRDHTTLIDVIKQKINDGTTIISHCCKSYSTLNAEGFQHLTVNHSVKFVDPESGAQTKHIERLWRGIKVDVPKYGKCKKHFLAYLGEYTFNKRFDDLGSRIHNFFLATGQLYNPHKNVTLNENVVYETDESDEDL